MTLFAMRLRGALGAVKKQPGRYILGFIFLGLTYWSVFSVTLWAVRFLDNYRAIDTVADAVAQRSLEGLLLVLMLSVAFSVLTTAITTLYSSDDLPFLLALPVAAKKVFSLKVAETYLNAAFMPAIFTLPVLAALGVGRSASLNYYLLVIIAVLALYAVPVALGSFVALILVRLAPAGRVKELATALSVLLAAGLIFSLRALRPERLNALSPEEFEQLLSRFASFELGALPSSWVSRSVWAALNGKPSFDIWLLLAVAALLLWLLTRLATLAYREGWIRSLDLGQPRLDPAVRGPAWWERPLYRLGHRGSIVAKDSRLLLRDPSQWSQLLVLLALAGVYLLSVGSVGVDAQRFKDALGTLNVTFLGFLLAGVGIRTAFPLVSLEAEGFWLLRTGPLKSRDIVIAKFFHALPIMAFLGGGLGVAAAWLIDVSPTLAFASPLAGVSAAIVTTALGVGLGAAFPRFDATNPAEIPLSPGGLLYMTLALAYAALLTVILAWPVWQTLRRPGSFYWSEPEGQVIVLALAMLTLLLSVLALWFGSWRLARYEPGS